MAQMRVLSATFCTTLVQPGIFVENIARTFIMTQARSQATIIALGIPTALEQSRRFCENLKGQRSLWATPAVQAP